MIDAMLFQAAHGASTYLAPSVPLFDADHSDWFALHERMLAAAISANASGDVPRRDVFAFVAPGRRALASPHEVVAPLADKPVQGIYVEPLRLDSLRASLEKLVQYVRFVASAVVIGVDVTASRIGAFGLVPYALGASFSSGLAEMSPSRTA